MVIDVHCHYIPDRYFEFLETEHGFAVERRPANGEQIPIRVGALEFALNRTFFDSERQIARMETLGIDLTILSLATPLINYQIPIAVAKKAARIFNDELARLRDRHPDRFDGWAFLPMQDPEGAAAELRRGVRELGLSGGHIASNVNGRYLNEPEYAPIFEAALDLNVPLFVHPANPPGRERMADYELAVVSGYLFDSTLNIFNMIFGGLLDRYPSLRLCCAHAGGYALMLRSRMQREVDTNPTLAELISRPVGAYLRQLYFDTICFEGGYLEFSAEIAGANQLVLGSDGPFPLGEPDPVGFVQRTFTDEDTRRGILHLNAASMFGTENSEASRWNTATAS